MSNWDLMMPGMGLTSIGLAGVVLAYSEISHTFIDGMHALAGLTMFIGLIFLAVGILDGGVSTSNRAKATVLVILSISLGFGAYAFTFNTVSTTGIFAGILMAIAAPATIIAYVSMKHQEIMKPISAIFIMGSIAGIAAFVAFGVVGPSPYLISEQAEIVEESNMVEEHGMVEQSPTDAPTVTVAILEGSAIQGAPDYEPDELRVAQGDIIAWVNEDSVIHTATSVEGNGEIFDSSIMVEGDEYRLDTTDLPVGEHSYTCTVHPWMSSVLIIESAKENTEEEVEEQMLESTDKVNVSIPSGGGISEPGKIYYDPETINVPVGTTVVWTNDDFAAHTVTSGSIDAGIIDLFDSGLMPTRSTFEITFEEKGEIDYFCILHPWMEGTVIVDDA